MTKTKGSAKVVCDSQGKGVLRVANAASGEIGVGDSSLGSLDGGGSLGGREKRIGQEREGLRRTRTAREW